MIVELPKVAVVLAAYNGMRWLEEQVDSIFTQESVSVYLFVSVDLSDDGTYGWFKQLESGNKNVKVLEYGERFGGAAKNFFRLIRDVDFNGFDYIAFADQDDVWYLDKLYHSINTMEMANANAYSANVIAFWEDGREILIDKSQPQKKLDYMFEAAGPGCTYLFSNKAASLIKNYLNDYPELNDFVLHDWLCYAILRHNNYCWIIDSEPKMRYRQHENNQVGANTSIKGMIYRINYIFSRQAYRSIELLINTLNISSIQISSPIGVLRLAIKVRELRRRSIDQLFAFIAILSFLVRKPTK